MFRNLLFILFGIVLFASIGNSLTMAASLGPISEENPPASCDTGGFIKEIKCTGKYCDNIKISCHEFKNAMLGSTTWTSWISEEHGGTRDCPANRYIAGLACKGKYCDNISLYCVELKNYTPNVCFKTRSVSEENGGTLSFFEKADKAGQLFAARSIHCSGKHYCDNKKFTVCEMFKP